MSWNYRVVRHKIKMPARYLVEMRKVQPDTLEYNDLYQIHEVYYKDNAPKEPTAEWVEAWSDLISPVGDSPEDLADALKLMLRATEQPVLDYDDLPTGKPSE